MTTALKKRISFWIIVLLMATVFIIACEPKEKPSLYSLAESFCKEMSTIQSSDGWRAETEATKRAVKAGYSEQQFSEALRNLCQETYTRYTNKK